MISKQVGLSHSGLPEKHKGWESDPEKHRSLLADLITIIQRHVTVCIGTSENVFEYKLIRNPRTADDPYFNCLLICVDSAAKYTSRFDAQEKVEMIFADHEQFGSHARFLYPQVRAVSGMYDRLGPDAYWFPKNVLPLQAADLIAFEYRKEIERRANASQRAMRWPLQQLKDKNWYNRGYFDFNKWPK